METIIGTHRFTRIIAPEEQRFIYFCFITFIHQLAGRFRGSEVHFAVCGTLGSVHSRTTPHQVERCRSWCRERVHVEQQKECSTFALISAAWNNLYKTTATIHVFCSNVCTAPRSTFLLVCVEVSRSPRTDPGEQFEPFIINGRACLIQLNFEHAIHLVHIKNTNNL